MPMGIALPVGSPCLRRVVQGNATEYTALVQKQISEVCLADARCVLQHGLKHWLKLTGRTTDDFQHIRGGRLLLQRFTQVVEQPRILDGDDGLRGEVLNQLDLLVAE